MNLEVRHLRMVEAIAREGNMTRAARELHLTQSALSHQLADIEERLSSPLFLRLRKRMMLTPAGERVLAAAKFVLEELTRAEEDARRAAAPDSGVLRLSTECYTCYHWLPSRLRLFQLAFPRVDIQVVLEATHHPVDCLLEGKLDLAIISEPLSHRQIQARPLFEDELVVILKPDHPLAAKTSIEAADFANQNLFTYDLPKEDLTLFQKVLNPAGILPARHSRVPLTEAIVELVRAGLGVGVMARWAVAPQLASGNLCARRLTRKGVRRVWSAATLRTASPPAYLARFVELLAEAPFQPRQSKASGRARPNEEEP